MYKYKFVINFQGMSTPNALTHCGLVMQYAVFKPQSAVLGLLRPHIPASKKGAFPSEESYLQKKWPHKNETPR